MKHAYENKLHMIAGAGEITCNCSHAQAGVSRKITRMDDDPVIERPYMLPSAAYNPYCQL